MSNLIRRQMTALSVTLGLLWGPIGCSLLDPESEVTLLFPAAPQSWKTGFDRVGCRLEAGSIARLDLPEWPDGLVWIIEAPTPVPITATPIADGRLLRPAGGIVYDTTAPVMVSWEAGPMAQVLQSLSRGQVNLLSLNVPRLHHEALRIDRPCDLDRVHLIESLLSGSIRVTDIRSQPTVRAVLNLPMGTWFWDTPPRPLVTSAGIPLVVDVPEGFHRLFCSGMTLYISVSEEETVTLLH